MLTGPSSIFLEAIYTVRKLYKPDNLELKAGEELLLNRKIAMFIGSLRSENPGLEKLVQNVTAYNESLRSLKIKDEEVNDITRKYSEDILPILKSLGMLVVNGTYALPGVLTMGPFAYLSKILAEIERKRVCKFKFIKTLNLFKALKQSTIKLEAIDVVASYKLVTASALFPLAGLGYTAFLHFYLKRKKVAPYLRRGITASFVVLFPFYLYCNS